jgi:hypothetical protein
MKTLYRLLLVLLMTGCDPVAPSPSTVTPASAPIVFASPTPTPSPTPSPVPGDPGGDVLSPEVQHELYLVSQAYLADTTAAAIPLARSMSFAQGNGDPSSMCGPLAISILRDAGFIDKYTDLQAFWLWRPSDNPHLAEITFPSARFQHFRFAQPLDQFDFRSFPLKAGDFLYIYAGDAGTFEHMLVVTRLDAAGRVYSVTNVKTAAGFIVREELLYDPARPGSGQFYAWTDRRNLKLGLTGFAGFELWRLTSPPARPSLQQQPLTDGIDQIIARYQGSWHLIIEQIDGPVVYARGADDRIPIASAVHLPVAMLFLKSLDVRSIPAGGLDAFLATHGLDRTYAQLLHAMLFDYDESAARTLLEQAGRHQLKPDQTLAEWDLEGIDLASQTATTSQVASLLEGLYRGKLLPAESRATLLNLMQADTTGQEGRFETLRPWLPAGSELYDFQEAMPHALQFSSTGALLTLHSSRETRDYVIVIFGDLRKSPGARPVLDSGQAIEQIARLFWTYVTSSP